MNRDSVQKPAANLSDTRRNRLGSAILRGILSVFGPAAACFLVKFIALAYALTDKQAEQRALPYLKHRFPDARGFRMKRHVWRLFTAQGEALIMALALANGQAKVRERIIKTEQNSLWEEGANKVSHLLSTFFSTNNLANDIQQYSESEK